MKKLQLLLEMFTIHPSGNSRIVSNAIGSLQYGKGAITIISLFSSFQVYRSGAAFPPGGWRRKAPGNCKRA
jgi:hypothetical protein